ncbi:MAG TPA: S41 family peptidase [Tahibacter sp.]|uniref:S41 family peptidase n=1 Tax=Tahibacter sp. TaxID=2056211 RepID=UPI002C4ACA9F|nr:S41 family peptidase [Tahibacter sp.]HSX58983.1 S41 family peptidase [Tahibacter sp.]
MSTASLPFRFFTALFAPMFAAVATAATLTPRQWHEDLAAARAAIAATHPDLAHSTSAAAVDHGFARVERQLRRPLDVDAGWRVLAALNPLFADAHLCVCYDDWRTEVRGLLADGGGVFPFAVDADADGRLVVTRWLGGAATPLAGARIAAINGVPADRIAAELLARVHGDTPRFRAGVLSQRFAFYYWKVFGAPAQFDVAFGDGARLRVAADRRGNGDIAGAPSFESAFSLTLLPSRAAVLRIDTFAWPDKEQVAAFHRDAFARLRDAGVDTLVIDVRNNGGGNDDQWIDAVLPYLATQPYQWASRYRKKIIEKFRKDGETAGAVVDGRIERVIEPQPGHPLRFRGKTYVLVGRGTYSSAVLFANVMQDYGFATLAGTGDAARARQSGGVQRVVLPHSKLVMSVPRFILERPSGAAGPALVTPGIAVEDDPLQPRRAVDALLARVTAAR